MLSERGMINSRPGELHIHSPTALRTLALGEALGKLLAPGDVICLSGEMGAGKTLFSRGIGAGWGASPPLSSPTYNLVHEHGRDSDGAQLYHLDCYRISGARDAETLGIHEILDSGGIVIFEWPQRALDILPRQHLWLDILIDKHDQRQLHFSAQGERHKALLAGLWQALGLRSHAAGD